MKVVFPHQIVLFCFCIVNLIIVQQTAISQTVQRQMVSAQGGIYTTPTGIIFSQSIGQLSVNGTTITSKNTFQQGFQQSFIYLFENKISQPNFTVAVYPNPFMDSFTIAVSNAIEEPITISIMTMLGQRVYQSQLASFQTQKNIPFAFYPSGTYLVQLLSKSQTISKKIIKN